MTMGEAEGYRRTSPVDHGANHSRTGEGAEMITIPQLTAQALGSFLAQETEGRFGSSHSDLTKLLPFAARLALECIGNSDALYHDIEHTMLVTLVGNDILAGRALQRTTGTAANGHSGPSSRPATAGPNIADHSTAATIAVTQRRSAQA